MGAVVGARPPLLDAMVYLLPGRPDASVMLATLDRLLTHRRPRIVFTRMEDGGAAVARDRPAQSVVDAWEAYDPSSFGVTAKGRGNTMGITTQKRAGDTQGWVSFDWEFDPTLTDGFVDLLVDLSKLLSSPLAVLSHQPSGWRTREGTHLLAVREAVRPARSQYGLFRGLAGVAHRMVLGDELVAMFGEDKLASLPPDLAFRQSGRWVLAPTADPLEWTADTWCPGEAAIIDALGPEHFFNPVTGALPTVAPELPKVAPYPCRTWDGATETWVEHNRVGSSPP